MRGRGAAIKPRVNGRPGRKPGTPVGPPRKGGRGVIHFITRIATDGITEARRGADFLGHEGMTRLAKQALPLRSLRRIGQAVLDGARAFAGGSLRDDACLLLARRR